MRIDLNASGIREMQSSFATQVKKHEAVINSFARVEGKTRNASGGVGNMRTALSNLENRVRNERKKLETTEKVKKKASEFVNLAQRVDAEVATKVVKNKNELYKKYPHLKPPKSSDEQSALEKIWNWICDGVETILDIQHAIRETLKKWAIDLVNGAIEFYRQHKELIDTIVKIVLTVVIVVGAVVGIIATWGAGLAVLAPILTAIGLSASTAAAVSSAIVIATLVSTGLAAVMDVVDLWFEIDHPVFNFFQATFNIISFAGNLTVGLGKAFNQAYKIDVSKGFKIRELAKTNMKEAMEMSVEDGTTNSWYLRNLADGQVDMKFGKSKSIDFGFKFGTHQAEEHTKYMIKWHSVHRTARQKYGPIGGGKGWTAQLSYRFGETFQYLTDSVTWIGSNRNPISHIFMPSMPTEGNFNVFKWAWDNKDIVWKGWTNPFR